MIWGFVCLLIIAGNAIAQQQHKQEAFIAGFRSSLYTASAGEIPYWFYSNADGVVDPGSANILNELYFQATLVDTDGYKVRTAGRAAARWSEDSALLIPEVYARASAYGLQLDFGRFPQPIGLNNHQLSVGSMMVSRNAVPVPKISISTPEFMDLPLADGHVQYKGMFGHGWLEEDRYVRSPYFHQKYLYLRVNIGPWSGTGGIIHNAQWGGTHPEEGRLPQSFDDYLRLITGRGAEAGSGAPGGEISNVIGNSVAAYEFGLRYRQSQYSVNLTRLFYLEDKVSTRFRSPWDGVWGVNLEFEGHSRWVSAVTYEHINTKNQDAKSFELIGRRDYYDNFVYEHGWTYENRTLGIPLILFDGSTISNNVLVGHHLGITGKPPGLAGGRLNYRFLATYSRNYGVQADWIEPNYDVVPYGEFRRDQYSLLLDIGYRLQNVEGLSLNLKLGYDTGELYAENLGLIIGAEWNWGR